MKKKIIILAFFGIFLSNIAPAAEAEMDVNDRSGRAVWRLRYDNRVKGYEIIYICLPKNWEILRIRIPMSDADKKNILAAFTLLEETCQDAKRKLIKVQLSKDIPFPAKLGMASLQFKVTEKGDYQMYVGNRIFTPAEIAALKDLVSNLNVYIKELSKAAAL